MRSKCTDVPIFLAQENTKNITKRHGYYFYSLYADTLPLRQLTPHILGRGDSEGRHYTHICIS